MAIINSVIKGGGGTPSTKYGATGDTFLGDIDANGVLQNANTPTNIVMSGVKKIGAISQTMGVLFRRFQNLASIKTFTGPDLEQVEAYCMQNCFYNCPELTDFSCPKLTSINGISAMTSCFYNCFKMTNFDCPNLTTIDGESALMSGFSNCTSLVNFTLKAQVLSGKRCCYQMLTSCSNLENAYFYVNRFSNSQESLGYALTNCSKISKVYFYNFNTCSNSSSPFYWLTSNIYKTGLDVYFPSIYQALPSDVFVGLVTTITNGVIHFPSNLDPNNGSTIISSLSGYPNFNGTNTTLLYDLPSSAPLTGANSQTYVRKAGDDTDSALAWYNPTLGFAFATYYTSGTTAPSVGDTIYTDSACTNALTTIASI